ncbi:MULTISPECIES: hypothetical protein [Pseudomonas]|uniref:Uncharacterized protein n=1 Tax=Pseudomonas koreensis TaxID=198620 RepID=A0AA94JEK9_9PSED|nr:hypothetical protein [Pseudomonas koreensis]RVD74433.1 hypothetical protein A9HBioS_5673 [Pseudomonas koreensis]
MEREIDMTGITMTEEAARRCALIALREDNKVPIIQKIVLQPKTKTAKITYDYRPFTPKELESQKRNSGNHPDIDLYE